MLSFRKNIILHIFLLLIYGIQVLTSLLFITDENEPININQFIKYFSIIIFLFNLSFFGYLIVKIYTLLGINYDYDYDYDFECIDYWFYVLMTTVYYIFIVFLYTSKFDREDRIELLENYNFRIFLYSVLPIGIIYITITNLCLISALLVLIYHCCTMTDKSNRIMPT